MKMKISIAAFALFVLLGCSAGAINTTASSKDDLLSKWQTLSDEQRQQVYELMDERAKIELRLLEKFAEIGLLDKEKAAEIEQDILRRMEDTRENQLFPGAGKGPREEPRRGTA